MNNIELAHKIAAVLTRLVAPDLVSHFRVTNERDITHIQLGDDAACHIWFREDERKGRLEIHGNFHIPTAQRDGSTRVEYYGGSLRGEGYKSITVALDATPEQIASNIFRRFLPGYLSAYREAAERASVWSRVYSQAKATREALARITGDTIARHQNADQFSLTVGRCTDKSIRCEFRIHADRVNEISLSPRDGLTVEQVAKLVELLKTF